MLTVDMRKIDDSGIGTYIRYLVPLILESLPDLRACLIGSPKRLEYLSKKFPGRIDIVAVIANNYSLQEQWILYRAIPRQTTLFWSPHYNIPLLYSGKLLVTVHDVFHLAMPIFVKQRAKQWYAKLMFQAVRRKASEIITVSRFTSEEFRKWVGESTKLRTVYNGIDERWFAIEKKPVLEEPYYLYVGNVKPHKNLRSLIRAFRDIADRVPHRLIIVGKKEGFITGDTDIDDEILSLEHRINFTGYVDDEQLRQYFAHATALVFPSLYEGFGFPPLEAMAAGTPVLASTCASIPEVCGDAALYFDPIKESQLSEAMLRIAGDVSLQASLREKGFERAKRYSWRDCAEQTSAIIKEVIQA